MSIASRIESIEEHIGDIYNTLELGGSDLTNVDKNIVNINSELLGRYKDYLANGTDSLWNNWDNTTAEGTELTLNNTIQAKMKIKPQGNTEQATSILPEGYTQVDYIESSGTQYIDTEYKPTGDTKIITELTTKTISDGNYFFYGSRDQVGISAFTCGTQPYTIAGYGYNNEFSVTSIVSNTTYHIEQTNNLIVNNSIVYSYDSQTFTGLYNLLIFALNNGSSGVNFKSAFKLHNMKIYEKNILVRNFIPCYRNSDNEIGLYDLVNSVFYTNAGTGTFTKGSNTTIPSPEYPSPVNNVTGDVEVKAQNGNLALNDNSENPDANYSSSGGGTSAVQYSNTDKGYYTSSHRVRLFSGLQTGSYTISIDLKTRVEGASSYSVLVNFKDSTGTNPLSFQGSFVALSNITSTYNRYSKSYTLPSGYDIIEFTFYNAIYWDKVQLVEGTTAGEYTPHQEQNYLISLGDIELCKIVEYQDYIYKENGKWYVKNNMYKKIFDSTDSLYLESSSSTRTVLSYKVEPDLEPYTSQSSIPNMLSTSFKAVSQQATWKAGDISRATNASKKIFIILENGYTSETALQWLIDNNVIIYVPLANPVITPITDTTLINQLNALEQAYSYNEQTNISQDGDLPFILDVTALIELS